MRTQQANKTYSNPTPESHIDSLINARHKERTKCNGLEKVLRSALQIRAVMASGEWVTNGKSQSCHL